MIHRFAYNLRASRWALASSATETWLVVDDHGPKGVRLYREDDDAVTWEVGGFTVMLAAGRAHLFTIPTVERTDVDASLVEAWLSAGRPTLKGKR